MAVAIFGMLLSVWLGIMAVEVFEYGRLRIPPPSSVYQLYRMEFFGPFGHPYYGFTAMVLFLGSLAAWALKPGKTTILAFIFIGWVLCGFPALFILTRIGFQMPGDGPIP